MNDKYNMVNPVSFPVKEAKIDMSANFDERQGQIEHKKLADELEYWQDITGLAARDGYESLIWFDRETHKGRVTLLDKRDPLRMISVVFEYGVPKRIEAPQGDIGPIVSLWMSSGYPR